MCVCMCTYSGYTYSTLAAYYDHRLHVDHRHVGCGGGDLLREERPEAVELLVAPLAELVEYRHHRQVRIGAYVLRLGDLVHEMRLHRRVLPIEGVLRGDVPAMHTVAA